MFSVNRQRYRRVVWQKEEEKFVASTENWDQRIPRMHLAIDEGNIAKVVTSGADATSHGGSRRGGEAHPPTRAYDGCDGRLVSGIRSSSDATGAPRKSRNNGCRGGDRSRRVAAVAEPVEPHFLWRPRLRDADDDMVLEAAVNGRAEAIVTFNARDFAGVADEFGLALLTPNAILRRM